jgi:hypothetical protein
MGPRIGLDDVEGRTILPLYELELRCSAAQPVASRYTTAPISLTNEVYGPSSSCTSLEFP